MTKMFEATKATITEALELEGEATRDVMKHYYHGKVMGILELSARVLNKKEYWDAWEHYKSEQERLL